MESLLGYFRRNLREQPLSYRILALTVLWSIAVTSVSTLLHLVAAYRSEVAQVERQLDQLERSYVPSLAASVWAVDRAQIGLMLEGLMNLPDLTSVKVVTREGETIAIGSEQVGEERIANELARREYPLVHRPRSEDVLGTLVITAGRQALMARLWAQAASIATSQAINVFLVSLFVFLIFQLWVNRHLRRMADYAERLSFEHLDEPLLLARRQLGHQRDELDQVADAINRMRLRLREDIQARERVEADLQRHRDELEHKVARRTEQLEAARGAAEHALEDLVSAQKQLVEVEKMASLGQLVAGVAHEVNTPLGVALTAASHGHSELRDLRRAMTDGRIARSRLDQGLDTINESLLMTERNIERAARLIQSFKQVSVDRTSDGRRSFRLDAFTDELVQSIASLWSKRPVKVDVQCDPALTLDSFPGALGQVLTNLVQNALLHGFPDNRSGHVRLRATALDAHDFELRVSDDGVGVDPGLREKIFEPFFTTKRNEGGTGLGLHIVYNLVTQKLGGRIDLISEPGKGCCFVLRVPLRAPG